MDSYGPIKNGSLLVMQISKHTLPYGIALSWYHPSEETDSPVITLGHGFCGILQALVTAAAEAFA